jgi:hypothetical protein
LKILATKKFKNYVTNKQKMFAKNLQSTVSNYD